MKTRTKILIPAIWFVMWMVTWPALLADTQQIYPDVWGDGRWTTKAIERANTKYRHDLSVSMLFGALPPMWVFGPFLTGFYEHGFQFGRHS